MSPRVPRLLLLSVALVLSSCSKKESVSEQPVRPVKAIQIGSPSTIDRKVITGKARPAEQVDIAFEVPGKLVELAVDVGDEVKKGQALAQLDPRDFRNAVAMAEAEAQRAAAQRDRVVKAFETNAVSAQDVTNAKAQSRAADAAVEIARKQLEETTIRAPYDGSIAATYVENFENVLGKQKVVRLIDLSRIEMVVDVPESLIPNVPYVESIEVVFAPFPEIKIPARVKEVGSEASELTRTFPVTLVMEQPEGATILPGMAGEAVGTAKLPEERLAKGITIPASCLVSADGEESYVWIVNPATGLVSRQTVTVARFTPYGLVVSEGLKAGDWVVTAGVHSLSEGQIVSLLES